MHMFLCSLALTGSDLKDACGTAVERAEALMRICTAMARECRGLDLLADRARTLRKTLTQLESQVQLLVK